jgi:hypothetical protein
MDVSKKVGETSLSADQREDKKSAGTTSQLFQKSNKVGRGNQLVEDHQSTRPPDRNEHVKRRGSINFLQEEVMGDN